MEVLEGGDRPRQSRIRSRGWALTVVVVLVLVIVRGHLFASHRETAPQISTSPTASSLEATPTNAATLPAFYPEGLINSWGAAPPISHVIFAVPLISTLDTDVTITNAVLVAANGGPGSKAVSVTVVKHVPTAVFSLPDPFPTIGVGGVSAPSRSNVATLLVSVAPDCTKEFLVVNPTVELTYLAHGESMTQDITDLPNAPDFTGPNWLATWAQEACQGTIQPASASYCPKHPQELTGRSDAQAFAAIKTFEMVELANNPTYQPGVLRLERVLLAALDAERGGQVRAECGNLVAGRTLDVYVRRTDVGFSSSLAQSVFFVSEVDGRLAVWQRAR